MPVPYTFGTATAAIPLTQLDSNFATAITIGNTAVYLGNTTTSIGNLSVANVTITSVSTPITPAQGGTGLTSITANSVMLGNATGSLLLVSPGSLGNVLVSTGTTWQSTAPASGGSVVSVSVTSANGFAGTVATPTSTPAITLTTSITGVLKGNGTAISAATAGTDYVAPSGALGTPSSGTLSACTVDGTNKVGYLNIPNSGAKTSSYTLVVGDVGKFIELGTGGTVVVPASIFAAGDAISIFNNTSASISCTCSAVTTVYKGGTDADISTFSVTTRGVATILFISATVAVVTGNLA
jgi:hypothetical protein